MPKQESIPSIHNVAFVESMHEAYLENRISVAPAWRDYFQRGSNGDSWSAEVRTRPDRRPPGLFEPSLRPTALSKQVGDASDTAALQDRVTQLIRAFRARGHIIAAVHPIGSPPPVPPELDPSFYGFTDQDLERTFRVESLPVPGPLTLRQILHKLRNTYCRSIGVQYMHIDDLSTRRWLQERMEQTENHVSLQRPEQVRILTRLTDAAIFEEFIRRKFTGAKSFSLEGCESLIPLLDLAIEKAGEQGVKEIVMGMAHRGRLNVLANILGKGPRQIFREFEDADPQLYVSGGDVKYHLGHSDDWITASGRRVHLSLCFNPSHLEFVNTVALGRVRAKQDRVKDLKHAESMALLIHGDAAFAGEGVIQETLNLSQLKGYSVGGTLHVIVNNQIGFTTTTSDGRSTLYATDVAKMLQVPIFHVNGEDPEAVAAVVRLAMDFREKFRRDVFVDMYGYRRWGHNEADEPSFTQPVLYRSIEKLPNVRERYQEQLLSLNGLTRTEADQIVKARRDHLEAELSESRRADYSAPGEKVRGIWERSTFHGGTESGAPEAISAVPRDRLAGLLMQLTQLPDDFTPHPKLQRIIRSRREMAEGILPLDWAAAEALAFASLATEGIRIRLSGQDCRRGTFSHRHAVLHDYWGSGTFTPLEHVAPDQAPVEIWNSPLSEAGVLGFDYGYSLDCPDGLVLWEAQFGDFANAAQVIIDQFLVSAEDKWRRLSGLVLLLPHGFEGQGPEHSSARLERFLNLVANDNIQVASPSTPAQYFHLLRRQALRRWRKPLVVMTPKSLLRNPDCISSLEELAEGSFQRILPDARRIPTPSRILMGSGKIGFELDARRRELKRDDIAILRLEQYYPVNLEVIEKSLASYPAETPLVWVQEEPENMGAWRFLRIRFGQRVLGRHPLTCISRPESASPATGSAKCHKLEQERILSAAFAIG